MAQGKGLRGIDRWFYNVECVCAFLRVGIKALRTLLGPRSGVYVTAASAGRLRIRKTEFLVSSQAEYMRNCTHKTVPVSDEYTY